LTRRSDNFSLAKSSDDSNAHDMRNDVHCLLQPISELGHRLTLTGEPLASLELLKSKFAGIELFLSLIRFVAISFLFVGAAAAQQNEATIRFNLFEMQGASVQTIFNFDAGYAEKTGVPVSTPFSLSVPKHNDIKRIADGKPDGGAFVKFTFAVQGPAKADGSASGLVFLENIQVIPATIPINAEADDPHNARVKVAADLLRNKALPSAVQGFKDVEILAIEEYAFKDYPGVHLIARYTDPSLGPMMLRLTANLNPTQGAGYVTIANINLTLAPVSGGETLLKTLSAQVANSLVYK